MNPLDLAGPRASCPRPPLDAPDRADCSPHAPRTSSGEDSSLTGPNQAGGELAGEAAGAGGCAGASPVGVSHDF